ncbi:PAN-3 domain-containing protein [Caenorhabditis elegans]|uniref:PAN-3 domain-containing protein n=1 Tax=Caenorhabditis elegans TaxID=6239 RepID=O17672_CAEEL|nr:PAN-3 domain-containing protein [Caenorhabditis elegans]CAB05704.2 PAN-3 domain-containing protein [Caenorhabditis elegans]|eukprot:NP_493487.2 C-type LECtin [Caenorhabditis elegans]
MNTQLYLFVLGILTKLAFSNQTPQKMILIHGAPMIYFNFTEKTATWETCITTCYSSPGCIVAGFEDGICKLFEIGSISTIKRLDANSGKQVAVKIISNLTSCASTAAGNSLQSLIEPDQPYNITISLDTWTIRQPPKCPENFQIFERPLGSWCIGVITQQKATQPEGTRYCREVYNGVLSGFDNNTEKEFVVKSTKGTVASGNGYQGDAYWVNGERKSSCMWKNQTGPDCEGVKAFTITDPLISTISYNWGDYEPSGMIDNQGTSNCIVFRVGRTVGRGTDDAP